MAPPGNLTIVLRMFLFLVQNTVDSRSKVKGGGVLASADASVVVDFSSSELPHRPDILQNDGGSFGASKGRDFPDLQDILKDDKRDSDVRASPHQNGKGIVRHHSPMRSPLEISMFVLLAAFCFAIVVSNLFSFLKC